MKILILLRDFNYGGGTPNLIISLLKAIEKNYSNEIKIDLWLYEKLSERIKGLFIKDINVFISNKKESLRKRIKSLKLLNKKNKYDYFISTCFRTFILARILFPKNKVIFWLHGAEIITKGYRKVLFKIFGDKFSIVNSFYTAKSNKLKNYRILYNGVSEDIIKINSDDFYDRFKIPQNSFVLINIGGWNELKNHITLLKAFDLLAEKYDYIYLLCIGETSELTNEIIKSIKNKNNIRIYDRIPNAARYIKNCNIYVHTCYKEAFGLSVVEAMLSGVPVVVPNSGAFKEIILNGVNGLLYDEPKSYINLMNAIETLMNDKETIYSIAINGKIYAEKNFNINTFAKNFINIIYSKENNFK